MTTGERRLLVLTDVGEEIDDEAALWLLCQTLERSPGFSADVVFVSGEPLVRAMRWAKILNSLGDAPRPGRARVRYLLGPASERHMRYESPVDPAQLRLAGMDLLLAEGSVFDGGAYDVVLQMTPLSGFTICSGEDFDTHPLGPAGALGRITARSGAAAPLHLIVGGVDATNCPADELHSGFITAMERRGFKTAHVKDAQYARWRPSYIQSMPTGLRAIVEEDEWNKALGRIPPFAGTLVVRFRVNCSVNYDLVAAAYAAFELEHQGSDAFAKAEAWWGPLAQRLKQLVAEGYVLQSRESDDRVGEAACGNPHVSEIAKSIGAPWRSMISSGCAADLAAGIGGEEALGAASVDEVMCWAVLLITAKFLKIYAFDCFSRGEEPDTTLCERYVLGSEGKPPLNFHGFPPLQGDYAACRAATLGSPMYDPAGMLAALVALAASEEQVAQLVDALPKPEVPLGKEARDAAYAAGYAGEDITSLLRRYFPL